VGADIYVDQNELTELPEAPPSLDKRTGLLRPGTRVASLMSSAIFPVRPHDVEEDTVGEGDPLAVPPHFERQEKKVKMDAEHLMVALTLTLTLTLTPKVKMDAEHLMVAVRRDDLDAVLGFIHDGFVHVNDASKGTAKTALHEACIEGSLRIAA